MIPGSMVLHERLATLYQELAGVHRQLSREAGEDWVDQRSSPLGSRLHCRLVRSGALPGYRAGRRVLVRKADLDQYLEGHRIAPTERRDEANEIDQLLAKMGGRAA
jgi:hypothetical protein